MLTRRGGCSLLRPIGSGGEVHGSAADSTAFGLVSAEEGCMSRLGSCCGCGCVSQLFAPAEVTLTPGNPDKLDALWLGAKLAVLGPESLDARDDWGRTAAACLSLPWSLASSDLAPDTLTKDSAAGIGFILCPWLALSLNLRSAELGGSANIS